MIEERKICHVISKRPLNFTNITIIISFQRCGQYKSIHLMTSTVPKEHRACKFLEFCRWRVHPIDSMFWSASETWMPGPRNMEEVYEAICKNGSQSAHRILKRTSEWLS